MVVKKRWGDKYLVELSSAGRKTLGAQVSTSILRGFPGVHSCFPCALGWIFLPISHAGRDTEEAQVTLYQLPIYSFGSCERCAGWRPQREQTRQPKVIFLKHRQTHSLL